MGSKNISLIGKELGIFLSTLDKHIKVGAIKLSENDIKSEGNCIEALQKVMNNLDNGTYSVHHDTGLFARFDVRNKQIVKLHRWSKNTGVLMPCWDYFKE